MKINRTRRNAAFTVCLFAMLSSCLCTPEYGSFKWRGKVWLFVYDKDESDEPVTVFPPGGGAVAPDDPSLPFTFSGEDSEGDTVPQLRGSQSSSASRFAAASSPPYYQYVLSALPKDAVYVFNQQTARLVSTIPIPTLPTGLAISHDGQRVYVGNQEIAAGNPFFPQAPLASR